MTSSIREKLQQIAGIQPSEHWLEDCLNELRLTSNDGDSPDAILQQILHHDLRDVVRFCDDNNSENNNSPAQPLRRAVVDSQSNANKKAILPNNFRLLVQVEELLDVSVNADVRLSVGPAHPTAPTAVGNQNHRCLKLVYSDGYPASTSLTLIAMEVSPIPALSVQSHAGIKVLLTGPMEFRHGLAVWHAGNATVLGGQVAELVQVQRTALQQAQRLAGVGVDPTIKALIWNPDGSNNNNEPEGKYSQKCRHYL